MLTLLHPHPGQPVAPHDVWAAWTFDPLVLGIVAAGAVAYQRGCNRSPRPDSRGWAFWAGIAAALVALVSPLERMAGSLAAAHMVQHMLLVVVAAPLLAWSRPIATISHAGPHRWRKATGSWRRRMGLTPRRVEWLTHPLLAWLSLAGSLWLWHSSYLYDRAMQLDPVHALEHGMFLIAAVWFWSSVLRAVWIPRHSMGPRILLLFTMGVQSVLLSAMLTFSDQPWYDAYIDTAPRWGITPIEDQRLAGLIMWIPGGLIYTGAALAILCRWIGDADPAPEKVPSTDT